MSADRRAMALVMLDLIAGSESDETLAERFGDHEAVVAGAAYLAGVAVEALALQRREPVPATVRFLRQSLSEGDDGAMALEGSGSRDARAPHQAEWRDRPPVGRCR